MKRQVFFSFHYNRDSWRASQVRNMGKVDGNSTFSDNDWEEVRYKSDAKIKEWIDKQLSMRSCLIVLVGYETSERKWVKYEIEKAMELHKGIVGIRIDRLKNSQGYQDAEGCNPFFNIITPSGVNGNQKCSDFGNSECSIFGIKTTVLLASAVQ